MKNELKINHFILSWFLTLITAGCLALFSSFGVWGFLVSLIAALLSLPFIIVFSILVKQQLNKKPPKQILHRNVFLLHLGGSILTWFGIVLFGRGNETYDVDYSVILLGYFLIDSFYFHFFIQRKYSVKKNAIQDFNLLDSEL